MPDEIEIPDFTGGNQPPVENQPTGDNPFLQGVDPADLEVIQKYADTWHQTYSPQLSEVAQYKQLGNIEDLQAALSVIEMANSDPVGFHKFIGEQLQELGLVEVPEEQQDPNEGRSNLPEYEGLPSAFVDKFQSFEQNIERFNAFLESQERASQNAQYEEQLDNILATLQNEHGSFDEAAVLGRMLNGMSPEEAVKDYQKTLQELVGTLPAKKNPPISLGNGGAPSNGVNLQEIMNDKKKRVSMIAQLLDQANNS